MTHMGDSSLSSLEPWPYVQLSTGPDKIRVSEMPERNGKQRGQDWHAGLKEIGPASTGYQPSRDGE